MILISVYMLSFLFVKEKYKHVKHTNKALDELLYYYMEILIFIHSFSLKSTMTKRTAVTIRICLVKYE